MEDFGCDMKLCPQAHEVRLESTQHIRFPSANVVSVTGNPLQGTAVTCGSVGPVASNNASSCHLVVPYVFHSPFNTAVVVALSAMCLMLPAVHGRGPPTAVRGEKLSARHHARGARVRR
jgi:hypothetical protein